MSVIDKIQINSTTYDVAAGAGNVAYSDAATYPDGSAGKEISQLKSDFADLEGASEETQSFLGIINTDEIAIDAYDSENATSASMGLAPFVYGYNLVFDFTDCVVTAIKLNVKTIGTLSIGVIDKSKLVPGQTANLSDAVVKETISITETGEQVVNLSTPFTVDNNIFVFIGLPTDTSVFYYGDEGSLIGFYYVYNNNWLTQLNKSLGINVYIHRDMKPNVDYPNLVNKVNVLEAMVEKKDVTPINAYAQNAATAGSFKTAPYVLTKDIAYDYYMTSFKMEVRLAGMVTIGKIKKQYVQVSAQFDASKLQIHETLTVNNTGVQLLSLKQPMHVYEDEYVFYGIKTDTAEHYYGGSGIDKGFMYVSNGVYASSANSVNVNIYGYTVTINPEIGTYANKTLSILGDSISTFSGYIPEGNVTYYPSGTVQDVTDTWWYKLYAALGMTLNVNNSWSGSRVTTTAGETSAGCMTRCQNLGTNPDVIIVWMGINDFNNEVALGTYDGTTALPETTTTFREAYAIMLNKILTAYPRAEVWVCTLPQCERNGESGFPEVNGNGVALLAFNKAILELADAFGVKVLDHNKCGLTYQNMPTYNPDNLHPNKYGHSLVANNDIRQMDNLVRMRYPIS